MQWSRVGLALVTVVSLLTITSVARADGMMKDGYYDGVAFPVIVPTPPVFMGTGHYTGCYHVMGHHHRHLVCPMYEGAYVCKKYEFEINPKHRSTYCSSYAWEWIRVHHRHAYGRVVVVR